MSGRGCTSRGWALGWLGSVIMMRSNVLVGNSSSQFGNRTKYRRSLHVHLGSCQLCYAFRAHCAYNP